MKVEPIRRPSSTERVALQQTSRDSVSTEPIHLTENDGARDRRLNEQGRQINETKLAHADRNALVSQQAPPQQPRQTSGEDEAERTQIAAEGGGVDSGAEDLGLGQHGGRGREGGVLQDLDQEDGGTDVGAGEGAEEGGGDEADEEDGGGGGGAGVGEAVGEGGDPGALAEAADQDEFADGEGEEWDWEAADSQAGAGEAGGYVVHE